MKKRLALLAFLVTTAVYADEIKTGGARILENPNSNADLKLRVNIGGSKTDALTLTGSTGMSTLGASGLSGTHKAFSTIFELISPTATTGALYFSRGTSGTTYGRIGQSAGANDLITGATADDIAIRSFSGIAFSGDDGASLGGRLSSTSAWLFGGSAADVQHVIQNTSTTNANRTLLVRNNSTSTSSDGFGVIRLHKGSTTNTAGANQFIDFFINNGNTGSGYIATNGANAAAFFNTSDRRLKKDIVPLTGAMGVIAAIKPVSFKWKDSGSTQVGFVAQDLAKVLPGVVHQTDDGRGDDLPDGEKPWTMTESGMLPYVIKAMQELKAENDALRARLDAAGIH